MTLRRLPALAMLLLAALLAPWPAAVRAADPLPPLPAAMGDDEAERIVLDEGNRARAAAGLPPLRADPRLRAAARLHAQDMLERGYLEHRSDKPGHENPTRRIHRAGALDFGAAENIARLPPGSAAQEFVARWLASPGHRANLLNPASTHIGVGVVRHAAGQVYGVQKFVARRLEPVLVSSRAEGELQLLRLAGQAEPGVQLALFDGARYLGRVATDAQGRFARELDFVAGQSLQLGWRRDGDAGAFLTQAELRMPERFEAGVLAAPVQAGAPFVLQAQLAARREAQQRLELRLDPASEGAGLIERIAGEARRTPFIDGRATLRCPLDGGQRVITLVSGSRVEARFGFDCASGRVEPGVEG